MATRGSVQQSLEEAGIDFIPPDKGVGLFGQELARSSEACEIVAAGRLGPFEADAFQSPKSEDLGWSLLPDRKVRCSVLLLGNM